MASIYESFSIQSLNERAPHFKKFHFALGAAICTWFPPVLWHVNNPTMPPAKWPKVSKQRLP